MTRTTLRPALLLALAATGASLGYVTTADAAYPAVLQLAPGVGGPKEKEGGAGNEHTAVTVMEKNGKEYVVSVYMSSNVDDNDAPWQCKCSSALLDPILGPVIVQDQVQLTNNGGNRPCNHPRIASNGSDVAVWTYGTNENNGNTRTYVQGINEMCELTTARLRISENNNQNEGAPYIWHNVEGNTDYFVAGYLSTANNDLDASYAVGVMASSSTVEKKWHTKVVTPSNIGRPVIMDAGPDRAFFCAAQGNNRPPEQGVACALLNTMTGQVIHKEIIAKSDPANNVYFNQPTIAKLGPNLFAVQVLESNGLGKKNNIKGSNKSHIYAIKVSTDFFSQEGYITNVGKYPTHSAICGGMYGEKGETHVAVLGASPTGLGQPSIQFVSWGGASFKVDTAMDNWTVGFYGDSGLISNLYGANPNTQGRNFMYCVGNVKNPGFGKSNGYMADVETFFLAPHEGNIPGDPKNAGYLSFVPGKVAKAVIPEAPKEQPKTGITPTPDTGGAGGAGGGENTGGTGIDTGTDTTEDPGNGIDVNAPQAGACSLPATNDSQPEGLAFLALGAVALLAARRRK
ncbi:MAG: MYXO-CTERM sorting domain-containing protein [Polyangiaceae bacterium]